MLHIPATHNVSDEKKILTVIHMIETTVHLCVLVTLSCCIQLLLKSLKQWNDPYFVHEKQWTPLVLYITAARSPSVITYRIVGPHENTCFRKFLPPPSKSKDARDLPCRFLLILSQLHVNILAIHLTLFRVNLYLICVFLKLFLCYADSLKRRPHQKGKNEKMMMEVVFLPRMKDEIMPKACGTCILWSSMAGPPQDRIIVSGWLFMFLGRTSYQGYDFSRVKCFILCLSWTGCKFWEVTLDVVTSRSSVTRMIDVLFVCCLHSLAQTGIWHSSVDLSKPSQTHIAVDD